MVSLRYLRLNHNMLIGELPASFQDFSVRHPQLQVPHLLLQVPPLLLQVPPLLLQVPPLLM